MYADLKYHLLSLIPGAGLANFIYLGLLIWILAIFLSNRKWEALTLTAIIALTFKAIDLVFLGQAAPIAVNEFAHMMIVPLILTLLKSRISKLG